MRFEPRRSFVRSKQYSAPPAPQLPLEIAFLEPYIDMGEVLRTAAKRATVHGGCAARSLIAHGGVSETLFYRCLSRHLDVPFVQGWPHLMATFDALDAIRRGRVKQANGTWLIAPTDAALKRLLETRAPSGGMGFVLTTPAHFAAIIRHRAAQHLAYVASDRLPDATPRLSARGAFDVRAQSVVVAIACVIGLGCWIAPTTMMDLVGLVFFVAMSVRLVICAFGLDQLRLSPTPIAERDAPFYTVLVPLYHEAHMVDGLVAALEQLDYPREKLEILFLIEACDHATRDALSNTELPPVARVISVPDGRPRTKPRALNAGLYVARGAHVTVYDAEDRPDPNQLRLAAAIFARSPSGLACLQARLRIDESSGLLAHLFAVEYAILFDLFNVGIARLGLPLALGGTSNHFRGMGQQTPKGSKRNEPRIA